MNSEVVVTLNLFLGAICFHPSRLRLCRAVKSVVNFLEQQRQFPVYYEAEHIGTLVPDLIVDDLVIADPKVVSAFNDTHAAQMIG